MLPKRAPPGRPASQGRDGVRSTGRASDRDGARSVGRDVARSIGRDASTGRIGMTNPIPRSRGAPPPSTSSNMPTSLKNYNSVGSIRRAPPSMATQLSATNSMITPASATGSSRVGNTAPAPIMRSEYQREQRRVSPSTYHAPSQLNAPVLERSNSRVGFRRAAPGEILERITGSSNPSRHECVAGSRQASAANSRQPSATDSRQSSSLAGSRPTSVSQREVSENSRSVSATRQHPADRQHPSNSATGNTVVRYGGGLHTKMRSETRFQEREREQRERFSIERSTSGRSLGRSTSGSIGRSFSGDREVPTIHAYHPPGRDSSRDHSSDRPQSAFRITVNDRQSTLQITTRTSQKVSQKVAISKKGGWQPKSGSSSNHPEPGTCSSPLPKAVAKPNRLSPLPEVPSTLEQRSSIVLEDSPAIANTDSPVRQAVVQERGAAQEEDGQKFLQNVNFAPTDAGAESSASSGGPMTCMSALSRTFQTDCYKHKKSRGSPSQRSPLSQNNQNQDEIVPDEFIQERVAAEEQGRRSRARNQQPGSQRSEQASPQQVEQERPRVGAFANPLNPVLNAQRDSESQNPLRNAHQRNTPGIPQGSRNADRNESPMAQLARDAQVVLNVNRNEDGITQRNEARHAEFSWAAQRNAPRSPTGQINAQLTADQVLIQDLRHKVQVEENFRNEEQECYERPTGLIEQQRDDFDQQRDDYRRERNIARQERDDLRRENDELQVQNTTLQQEKEGLLQRLQELEQAMQVQVRDAERKAAKQKAAADEVTTALEVALENEKDERYRCKEERDQYKAQRDQFKGERDAVAKTVEEQKDIISVKQDAIQNLIKGREEADQRAADAETKAENIINEVERNAREFNKKTALIEYLEDVRDSLETRNRNLTTEKETLETENANLLAENNNLKTRKEDLKSENEILKSENEDLKFENENLKGANGDLEAGHLENEQERMNINDPVQQSGKAMEELQKLQRYSKDELKAELDAQKNRLAQEYRRAFKKKQEAWKKREQEIQRKADEHVERAQEEVTVMTENMTARAHDLMKCQIASLRDQNNVLKLKTSTSVSDQNIDREILDMHIAMDNLYLETQKSLEKTEQTVEKVKAEWREHLSSQKERKFTELKSDHRKEQEILRQRIRNLEDELTSIKYASFVDAPLLNASPVDSDRTATINIHGSPAADSSSPVVELRNAGSPADSDGSIFSIFRDVENNQGSRPEGNESHSSNCLVNVTPTSVPEPESSSPLNSASMSKSDRRASVRRSVENLNAWLGVEKSRDNPSGVMQQVATVVVSSGSSHEISDVTGAEAAGDEVRSGDIRVATPKSMPNTSPKRKSLSLKGAAASSDSPNRKSPPKNRFSVPVLVRQNRVGGQIYVQKRVGDNEDSRNSPTDAVEDTTYDLSGVEPIRSATDATQPSCSAQDSVPSGSANDGKQNVSSANDANQSVDSPIDTHQAARKPSCHLGTPQLSIPYFLDPSSAAVLQVRDENFTTESGNAIPGSPNSIVDSTPSNNVSSAQGKHSQQSGQSPQSRHSSNAAVESGDSIQSPQSRQSQSPDQSRHYQQSPNQNHQSGSPIQSPSQDGAPNQSMESPNVPNDQSPNQSPDQCNQSPDSVLEAQLRALDGGALSLSVSPDSRGLDSPNENFHRRDIREKQKQNIPVQSPCSRSQDVPSRIQGSPSRVQNGSPNSQNPSPGNSLYEAVLRGQSALQNDYMSSSRSSANRIRNARPICSVGVDMLEQAPQNQEVISSMGGLGQSATSPNRMSHGPSNPNRLQQMMWEASPNRLQQVVEACLAKRKPLQRQKLGVGIPQSEVGTKSQPSDVARIQSQSSGSQQNLECPVDAVGLCGDLQNMLSSPNFRQSLQRQQSPHRQQSPSPQRQQSQNVIAIGSPCHQRGMSSSTQQQSSSLSAPYQVSNVIQPVLPQAALSPQVLLPQGAGSQGASPAAFRPKSPSLWGQQRVHPGASSLARSRPKAAAASPAQQTPHPGCSSPSARIRPEPFTAQQQARPKAAPPIQNTVLASTSMQRQKLYREGKPTELVLSPNSPPFNSSPEIWSSPSPVNWNLPMAQPVVRPKIVPKVNLDRKLLFPPERSSPPTGTGSVPQPKAPGLDAASQEPGAGCSSSSPTTEFPAPSQASFLQQQVGVAGSASLQEQPAGNSPQHRGTSSSLQAKATSSKSESSSSSGVPKGASAQPRADASRSPQQSASSQSASSSQLQHQIVFHQHKSPPQKRTLGMIAPDRNISAPGVTPSRQLQSPSPKKFPRNIAAIAEENRQKLMSQLHGDDDDIIDADGSDGTFNSNNDSADNINVSKNNKTNSSSHFNRKVGSSSSGFNKNASCSSDFNLNANSSSGINRSKSSNRSRSPRRMIEQQNLSPSVIPTQINQMMSDNNRLSDTTNRSLHKSVANASRSLMDKVKSTSRSPTVVDVPDEIIVAVPNQEPQEIPLQILSRSLQGNPSSSPTANAVTAESQYTASIPNANRIRDAASNIQSR